MPLAQSPTSTSAARKRPPAKKPPAAPPTLAQVMAALEAAGSAQTRKTYVRHGAPEPMFGVSFAHLKTLVKRIKVHHELANALWMTGNLDARILAIKVADPARTSAKELDRWVHEAGWQMIGNYVAQLAAETAHGQAVVDGWLKDRTAMVAASGWALVGQLAVRAEQLPDAWFKDHLTVLERNIHTAPSVVREAMHQAVISIGCRSAALRKAAVAAARRIGSVEVDHGDTACETPDAVLYIDKTWAHAGAKGFDSPAAQERARESIRTRC